VRITASYGKDLSANKQTGFDERLQQLVELTSMVLRPEPLNQ